MKKNECYTYFYITGDFDVDDVIKMLDLEPFAIRHKYDLRKDGKPFGFDSISLCKVDEYDPYAYVMMEKTIEPLVSKIDVLNRIKEKYSVEYYLTVVPTFYINTVTPCLSPSMKVIDFCHNARVELDIDYYVLK